MLPGSGVVVTRRKLQARARGSRTLRRRENMLALSASTSDARKGVSCCEHVASALTGHRGSVAVSSRAGLGGSCRRGSTQSTAVADAARTLQLAERDVQPASRKGVDLLELPLLEPPAWPESWPPRRKPLRPTEPPLQPDGAAKAALSSPSEGEQNKGEEDQRGPSEELLEIVHEELATKPGRWPKDTETSSLEQDVRGNDDEDSPSSSPPSGRRSALELPSQIEEGDGGEGTRDAIEAARKMEILVEKILPEDRLMNKLEEERARLTTMTEEDKILTDGGGRPIDVNNPAFGIGPYTLAARQQHMIEIAERSMEERRKSFPKNPWSSFALATYEDRELFSRVSVADAQTKARQRLEQQGLQPRIGDDIGTGAASPNAYVEIGPRPGPAMNGPEMEALNAVVSGALGISLKKASKLINIGAVWAYDDYDVKGWERLKRDRFIEADKVLRVFPNPERFRTCYVEDWRDRVKKVDPDFVVVDKPPLLPCFAKVANGRESLGQCLREALHVREWGGINNLITEDFTPCHEIDDEASGLVVLSRHEKAVEAFDKWLINREVVFEFVALCTANIEKGTYRHFYNKSQKIVGQPKPALYDEIPPHLLKHRRDYDNWEIAQMEVVATAPLPGGCAAVRIRTYGTGYQERIRAQLAILGSPVLNDSAIAGTPVPQEVAQQARLIPAVGSRKSEPAPLGSAAMLAPALGVVAPALLGGAVDEETMRGPYGYKLQLMKTAQRAAEQGVPQTPRKKVTVALHLARIEFGGRVVTCAPPPYWPEGAAAAVAVKLTTKDIKENVRSFITTHGGHARFGLVGGQFGVKVEWLEEHFVVDRAVGLVFVSEDAKKEWESERRVKSGDKAWGIGIRQRRSKYKENMMEIKEKYVAPSEMGFKSAPRFKQIKRGKVKPVNS